MQRLLLIVLLLIVGCEKPQREIIVAKWADGGPKKVNYVVGEGVKQEIVGRITYYENGEIQTKGEYEKGKKHGKHEYYDENGQIIKEETYKDGKLDGLTTEWYESGQKRIEGSYKDGEHTGIWTSWDSLGVEIFYLDWFQKGYNAGENEEYDKAISFYEKAIELNPDHADAYWNRSIAKDALGDKSGGLEDTKKAARLGNQSAQDWLKKTGYDW